MKYKDWLEKWLLNYAKPMVKCRTYVRYSEMIESHIIPSLGDYEFEEITPHILQCFVARLLASGNIKNGFPLSTSSVNSIITLLRLTLKEAYELGLCEVYSADKIRRPRTVERRVDCFSIEEQKRIEKYVLNSPKYEKLYGIILCLYTGLRIGELLALEWSDIDFRCGILSVDKACYYVKNEEGVYTRFVDIPKTNSSIRKIPLPKQLLSTLKAIKKESHTACVVSNGKGAISVRSYQRSFSAILRELGISHRGFHSLRHTFATRAIECGMDVKTLSEILGHNSSSVTLNRYAHSLTEHKKDMMNRLGKLL